MKAMLSCPAPAVMTAQLPGILSSQIAAWTQILHMTRCSSQIYRYETQQSHTERNGCRHTAYRQQVALSTVDSNCVIAQTCPRKNLKKQLIVYKRKLSSARTASSRESLDALHSLPPRPAPGRWWGVSASEGCWTIPSRTISWGTISSRSIPVISSSSPKAAGWAIPRCIPGSIPRIPGRSSGTSPA